jgi:hypothetical protein
MSIQIGSKSELEKGMAWCYYRHDCQCPIEKYSECIKGTQEPKATLSKEEKAFYLAKIHDR